MSEQFEYASHSHNSETPEYEYEIQLLLHCVFIRRVDTDRVLNDWDKVCSQAYQL